MGIRGPIGTIGGTTGTAIVYSGACREQLTRGV
jgi:hypothetical protein